MAIELSPLWDFSRPEASEQRFRAALATATGDDALILRTQIARSFGLRKEFDRARRLLREIEREIDQAGAEAKARFHLEMGRTHASATHPPALLTDEAKALARAAYDRALGYARTGALDALAIDAVHMHAFVDNAPADQLRWGEIALNLAMSSQQPDAQRWEAPIRNNIGYALHQLGRYEEALDQFRRAVAIRAQQQNDDATRVALWMVAWTLRSLNRLDEALEQQLELERAADAAGKPDPYVFEELEALYKAQGNLARAQHYAQRKAAAGTR